MRDARPLVSLAMATLVVAYVAGVALSSVAYVQSDAIAAWARGRGLSASALFHFALMFGRILSTGSAWSIGLAGWQIIEVRKVLANRPTGALTRAQVYWIVGGVLLFVAGLVVPIVIADYVSRT
jgi:hypothetical protein